MAADAERAVERLLDDEMLRGDLEDDAYGALINVTAELAIARSTAYDETDSLYQALHDLLAGAVESVQSGDQTALIEQLEPPLVEPHECCELATMLPELGDSPAADAQAIAGALSAVLLWHEPVGPTEPELAEPSEPAESAEPERAELSEPAEPEPEEWAGDETGEPAGQTIDPAAGPATELGPDASGRTTGEAERQA